MAFDVNFNNAQFNQFVQFAQQAGKATTIAKMSDEVQTGPLAGRTIVAKFGDSVGNIGRLKGSRDVNNKVRTLFKNTIIEMFGGEDRIPESVRDAMKMADFGKGKPLTARRILAVKTAVDQIAAKAQASIAECKAKFEYTAEGVERGGKAIETAFAACNGNADAMDIVKANVRALTVNALSELRTEAEVQNKVDGLIANLNELKEVSKNNPGFYAAGKQMLMETGVALPKGMISKLAQTAANAPLGTLRKLSGSSSGMGIHKAAMQMFESIQKAMEFSGAEKLDGSEEKMGARTFVATAILSRCSKGVLANIRKAMDSETASMLKEYYSLSSAGDNPFVENESQDVQDGAKDVGDIGYAYLDQIDKCVNRNLERLNPGTAQNSMIQEFDGQVVIEDIGGDDLVADTIAIAKDLNARNVANFANQVVGGSGKGAEVMKGIVRTKLDGANNPAETFGKRLNANANAMMNWNICGEMKKLATGDGAQFKKDIDRGTNATLTDGKTTFRLSNDFETARNELARFVTGDPNATYASLDAKPEDKAKVHLLMSVISQETEKAGENGASYALDKREAEDSFTLTGFKEKAKQALRTYTIEKRADGGIDLHYVMDKPIKEIDDGNTGGDGYPLGEGSKFTCKIDYTLKGAEFNRLAKLDYSKFNDEKGYDIFNHKIDMPDGSRQFRENKLEKVVDTFAEEFKIDSTCHMDFTMTLNPSDEEQILQNSKLQGGSVVFNP